MKTINSVKFYNLFEVAEMMGVHVQTVRRLIAQNKLRAVRIGYMDHITETALNDYLGITTEA